jgi:hypothetical protein
VIYKTEELIEIYKLRNNPNKQRLSIREAIENLVTPPHIPEMVPTIPILAKYPAISSKRTFTESTPRLESIAVHNSIKAAALIHQPTPVLTCTVHPHPIYLVSS